MKEIVQSSAGRGEQKSFERHGAHNPFGELEKGAPEDTILGADLRINAINSAIRNQARSEQGLSSVLIRELIDECLTVVGHRLKGIAVEVVCPDDLVVDLIRPQFGQVLMNLLSNASTDAIVEQDGRGSLDGRIKVNSVEALGDMRCAINIDDSGPGVPPELRAKILEPFFTTKGVGKGGVGRVWGCRLFLRILEAHEMKLEIQDAPELGGARFRMSPSLATCMRLSD